MLPYIGDCHCMNYNDYGRVSLILPPMGDRHVQQGNTDTAPYG